MAKMIVKKQDVALVNWDAELAKYAEDAAAVEQATGGSFISIKGGQISVNGAAQKDNKLNCIVVASVHENQLYEDDYDPSTPASPVCYAFATDPDEMSPHEKATDKKSDACKGCEFNEWGSADKGKGKACKNVRRLAVISTNGLDAGNIGETEVFYLKVPVTSAKAWTNYVQNCAAVLKRPPFAVETQIGVVAGTPFKLTFNVIKPADADLLPGLKKKHDEAMNTIAFPYPEVAKAEKPAPKGKRKF